MVESLSLASTPDNSKLTLVALERQLHCMHQCSLRVATFANLGGDAVLVSPLPTDSPVPYIDLARYDTVKLAGCHVLNQAKQLMRSDVHKL